MLTNKEFVEKAQEYLPEDILLELGKIEHTASLTATCEGHSLFSFIIDYGANILASQIGLDEVKAKIWPAIQNMVRDVNEAHIQSLGQLREKYPTEFAEAERLASKSTEDKEYKLALLREMLGDRSS